RELRDRLRNAAIAFVVAFVGAWFFAEKIYLWLRVPIDSAWFNNADKLGTQTVLAFSKPTEPFWVYMSVAMWAGIFVASPLIFYLAMVGLVTHRGLWKFNRWFIVLAFIIGAILTPSPDVISQIMMAVPMIALYNASILAAYFVVRSKEKKKAEQRARERAAEER